MCCCDATDCLPAFFFQKPTNTETRCPHHPEERCASSHARWPWLRQPSSLPPHTPRPPTRWHSATRARRTPRSRRRRPRARRRSPPAHPRLRSCASSSRAASCSPASPSRSSWPAAARTAPTATPLSPMLFALLLVLLSLSPHPSSRAHMHTHGHSSRARCCAPKTSWRPTTRDCTCPTLPFSLFFLSLSFTNTRLHNPCR